MAVLNRFTKWHPHGRVLDIYYLLSLHRRYQAQVMFTKLHLPWIGPTARHGSAIDGATG
jgi:hypothetical protein